MRRAWSILPLLVLLLAPSVVRANSAPLRPTGPTFQPTEATRVRMEHERIEMHVERAEPGSFSQTLVARMRVVFRFMPEEDETMTAGFPLWPSQFSASQVNLAYRITTFAAWADGTSLPYREEMIEWHGHPVPWAVYTLSFVAGQPMELEVAYEIEFFPGRGNGSNVVLQYILQTGALWAGTIGKTEAVVTFDRPLTDADVLPGTLDGWSVQDGAVHWEWQDFEPDFDIWVVLRNRFWYDLPEEIGALLSEGALSRQELLHVHGALLEMFGGVLHGYWAPVGGGKLSGEAAIDLLPQTLEAMRSVMVDDPDLQAKYLQLLHASLFRQENGPVRLVSPERLRFYLDEAERLGAEGIRPVPATVGDEMEWWAWFAVDTYYGTEDPFVREQALRPIIAMMPNQFSSNAGADGWVERLFRFPRHQLPPVLPDGLKEAVTALARAKVETAASESMPVAAEPTAEGVPTENPAPTPKRTWVMPLLLVGAALGASGWLLYRRRSQGE